MKKNSSKFLEREEHSEGMLSIYKKSRKSKQQSIHLDVLENFSSCQKEKGNVDKEKYNIKISSCVLGEQTLKKQNDIEKGKSSGKCTPVNQFHSACDN